MFEQRRAELEKNAATNFAKAQERATKLNDLTIEIAAQANDEGKLYGSITVTEIVDAVKAKGMDLAKREVQMSDPIYSVGDYELELILHSDVIANLRLSVVAAK